VDSSPAIDQPRRSCRTLFAVLVVAAWLGWTIPALTLLGAAHPGGTSCRPLATTDARAVLPPPAMP